MLFFPTTSDNDKLTSFSEFLLALRLFLGCESFSDVASSCGLLVAFFHSLLTESKDSQRFKFYTQHLAIYARLREIHDGSEK